LTLLATPPAVVPWALPPPDTHAASEGYRRALATLWAFSETPRSPTEIHLARERKLDRIRTLLGLLGSPQATFETILVAGTKGKGSTAAMLASILHSAGRRVGRYTQPHLYSYRERTWAAGNYIAEDELVDEVASMSDALAVMHRSRTQLGPLTTFDVGTALSLVHFARSRVELAVVEVGVGGANDATNALEPILALIGPVGLDHVDVLGSDLSGVAREKAGVMRRGIDAIVAQQEPCAEEAIADVARAVGSRTFGLRPSTIRANEVDGSFDVSGPDGEIRGLSLALAGRFQRSNAAMAVSAAQLLNRNGRQIEESAIRTGLETVQWPGRFQTVVRHPLTIVDGAHNPYAARALADTIRTSQPNRPLTLILGMPRDKDMASTVAELAPLANRIILTRARHERSCPPDELADVVREVAPHIEHLIAPRPGEALERAWATQPDDGVTIVTGSLFLVGDVLEWLLPRAGVGGQGPGAGEER
jgi:dihydrofolate synthase / folylpolyglutamate synthase